ncbi:MAG: hypothetical protein H0W12_07195, partial [Chitinophagaceae bacterium]|nr:hypothetical protein [Chitinophagaceae bacterium]
MHIFTTGLRVKNLDRTTAVVCLLLFNLVSEAQFRNYTKVYSDNTRGGIAIFGNTLMHILKPDNTVDLIKMNDNSTDGNSYYGNDNENMQYIDVDGNTGTGAVTRNSSTADLILPAGINTIKMARLY